MPFRILLTLLLASPAWATNEVLSDGTTSFNDVVNDAMMGSHTTGNSYSLRYRFYCFGHNLRGKPAVNVASASANSVMYRPEHDGNKTTRYTAGTLEVNTTLRLHDSDGKDVQMRFVIPVTMGEYRGKGKATDLTFSPNIALKSKKMVSSGNLTQINLSNEEEFIIPDGASMPESEAIEATNPVKKVRLTKNGKGVYQRAKVRANKDGSIVNIYMSWPGKDGPCHNYYSPLMLFSDNDRPTLTGESEFQLAGSNGVSYWVEENAPGEFLALDVNGNGKIDDYTELFSESRKYKNGFESLKVHDKNRDGRIDSKDKVFSQLLMWHDKNGDGLSQKEEMTPATEKGLVSISLDYDSNTITPVGYRGEFRERASYQFKNAKGETQTGKIIDVWFGRKSSAMPLAQMD